MEDKKQHQEKPPQEQPIEAETTVSMNMPVSQERAERTSLFVGDTTAASRYLDAVCEFRKMIPRATKPTDWVSFGSRETDEDLNKCGVYLQEYAASQISRLLQTKFGYTIRIKNPVHLTYPDSPTPWGIEKVIDGVAHLEVIVQGAVEVTDNATGMTEYIGPIMGASTTTDPFFTKRHGELKDPRSVPFGDLLKKAIANYKGNCYREIWGLKGFTMADLKVCGLDVTKVHDSMRRQAGASATPEEKNTKQELWKRILRVHDDKPELARKFLKNMTSYPAGKRADGTEYKANEGYDDINRIYLTNKDGSENKTYRKILTAIEKLEKEQGVAAEETQASAEASTTQGAGGHGKKKLDYISRLGACKTEEQVMSLEKEVAKDTTLSKDDIDDMQGRISRKFDQLVADKEAKRGSGR